MRDRKLKRHEAAGRYARDGDIVQVDGQRLERLGVGACVQHPNNEASRRPAPRPIRRSDRCREVTRFSQ
jgi:hypothetical protein